MPTRASLTVSDKRYVGLTATATLVANVPYKFVIKGQGPARPFRLVLLGAALATLTILSERVGGTITNLGPALPYAMYENGAYPFQGKYFVSGRGGVALPPVFTDSAPYVLEVVSTAGGALNFLLEVEPCAD